MEHRNALDERGFGQSAIFDRELHIHCVPNVPSPLSPVSPLPVRPWCLFQTYPSPTLFHMGHKAVWLHTPLQDLMDENDLVAVSVKEPAGDQVFGQREFWESSDRFPRGITDDESTTRAPRSANGIPNTIIARGACDIRLVQRIVVGDVVEVLWTISTSHGVLTWTAYLGSGNHADFLIDDSMWDQCAEDARLRNHICIQHSNVFMLSTWKCFNIFHGGVDVPSLVAMRAIVWLDTGMVVKVGVSLVEFEDFIPQYWVVSIISKDDAELVDRIVNLACSFDGVKDNISRLSTANNEEVNSRDLVTQDSEGWSGVGVADEIH